MVNGEISVLISTGLDVINARQRCRWMAEEIGFRGSDVTLLSTVVSELARRAMDLDCSGNIVIRSLQHGGRKGLSISIVETPQLQSEGPDLEDWTPASRHKRFSTDDRLLLLATRHVADEFEVRSAIKEGSIIRIVKWL